MASNNYSFTPNEVISSWVEGDFTIFLRGYVDTIEGYQTIFDNIKTYKIIVNNSTGKRVRVIFWNKDALQYKDKIQHHSIIHIGMAYGTEKSDHNIDDNENIADIELNIGKLSVVEIKKEKFRIISD